MNRLDELKQEVKTLSNQKASLNLKKNELGNEMNELYQKDKDIENKMESVLSHIALKNEFIQRQIQEKNNDNLKLIYQNNEEIKKEISKLNHNLTDITHLNAIYELKKKEIDKSIAEHEKALEMLKNDEIKQIEKMSQLKNSYSMSKAIKIAISILIISIPAVLGACYVINDTNKNKSQIPTLENQLKEELEQQRLAFDNAKSNTYYFRAPVRIYDLNGEVADIDNGWIFSSSETDKYDTFIYQSQDDEWVYIYLNEENYKFEIENLHKVSAIEFNFQN